MKEGQGVKLTSDFLEPVGPHRLAAPYGSYLWETEQPLVDLLRRWRKGGVFPETHARLRRAGLCDRYRLTPATRKALETSNG